MELPTGLETVNLNPIDKGVGFLSDPAALDHQLQLANCSTANVEAGPTQCEEDRRCHEDEPEVHESSRKVCGS